MKCSGVAKLSLVLVVVALCMLEETSSSYLRKYYRKWYKARRGYSRYMPKNIYRSYGYKRYDYGGVPKLKGTVFHGGPKVIHIIPPKMVGNPTVYKNPMTPTVINNPSIFDNPNLPIYLSTGLFNPQNLPGSLGRIQVPTPIIEPVNPTAILTFDDDDDLFGNNLGVDIGNNNFLGTVVDPLGQPTNTNLLGGNTNNLLGGNTNNFLGGNTNNLLGGNTNSLLGGNTNNLLGGNTNNLLGGDTTNLLSGNANNFIGGTATLLAATSDGGEK